MSARMEISAHEHGFVRLFAVDLPRENLEGFDIDTALGIATDPAYVELFDTDDLEDLGLRGYMSEGLGIAAEELSKDAALLDALKGPVLVLLSAAFGGNTQTLTPRAPLRWIGTWHEEAAPIEFRPMPCYSSDGRLTPEGTPPAPANPHLRVLLAILALPVLALMIGVILYAFLR